MATLQRKEDRDKKREMLEGWDMIENLN